MVSVEAIIYSSLGWASFLFLAFLTLSVFRNFMKKKTTGTLLLFATYFILFLSRILTEVQKTLQLTGIYNNTINILIGITLSTPMLVSVFLYAFSCRGLINHSEFVRTLIITLLSLITGGVFVLHITNIFVVYPEGLFSLSLEFQTPEVRTFSITFTTIAMIVTQFAVYLTIGISSLRLAKNSTEIVRKRGFQYIGWGLMIFLFGGILSGAASAFGDNVTMDIIFEVLRRLVFLTSYFMLYIGWTMPDWFRKRVRKKSWFAKQYSADITV